ncbi:DUF3850 domain-containing protein [Bacillus atrophaeus]|uniref:DUF3850 domain-containing protein n=1 Tax=Bacillus atrophaeus TaxID=1452 RepID=UPI00227F537F|nr:DUF3850 domain-containing protein [Bacillus atrophaeus]MCY8977800.1 DUF3850 domain-containing protein [Bacillus atrophaeus]WNV80276.1 DUF3850 domain-containing protein [Bacillus atrophaeus]
MIVHHLKILPEEFEAISKGAKEVTVNENFYKVKDVLCLHEWKGECTKRVIEVLVLDRRQSLTPGLTVLRVEKIKEGENNSDLFK